MDPGVSRPPRFLPVVSAPAPALSEARSCQGGVEGPAPRAPAGLRPLGDASREETERERRFRPELYWYVSFRCNLACVHCSVCSSPHVDTSSDLTTAQAMQVIDQLVDLNVGQVMLTGGEALLRRDTIDILRALGERGIAVSLESNGLLFSEPFAEVARDMQKRRLLTIGVSLDGGTAETHERLRGPNTFRRTVRGLHFLKDRGIKFNVQCILNRANYRTIPDLYVIARELTPQLQGLGFGFLNAVGRGADLIADLGVRPPDMFHILELVKREKATFNGLTIVKSPPAAIPPQYLDLVFKDPHVMNHVTCAFPLLGVLPNGDVTICGLSRDDEELHFGNVLTHSLREIWEKTRMSMLRSRYLDADALTGICGDCIFKHACKGGCRAWAYEEGRSFDAPLPLCAALAEAGAFPKMYRVSENNKVMAARASALAAGCACH